MALLPLPRERRRTRPPKSPLDTHPIIGYTPVMEDQAMPTLETPGPMSGTFNPDGKLSCGCVLFATAIRWCATHAAAPKMLAYLTLAAEGLQEYYEYGQKMREIGRGFDWGDTPGASTEGFVRRVHALLATIEPS